MFVHCNGLTCCPYIHIGLVFHLLWQHAQCIYENPIKLMTKLIDIVTANAIKLMTPSNSLSLPSAWQISAGVAEDWQRKVDQNGLGGNYTWLFGEQHNSRSGVHLHCQVANSKSRLGGDRGGLLCSCHPHDHQLLQGVAGVASVNDDHHPPHHWAGVPQSYSLPSKGVKHCSQPSTGQDQGCQLHLEGKARTFNDNQWGISWDPKQKAC